MCLGWAPGMAPDPTLYTAVFIQTHLASLEGVQRVANSQ